MSMVTYSLLKSCTRGNKTINLAFARNVVATQIVSSAPLGWSMRILIAEDEAITRKVLKRAVSSLGHDCIEAADGDEAWAMFQADKPDVIISDRMMPGMEGLELCRRVRESDTGYTYFVLVTGLDEVAQRLEGMRAGADDYLPKPLDKNELELRLIAAERVTALHRQIRDQQQSLEQLNEKFYRQGRIDTLTDIPNRLQLQEDMARLNARVRRYKHSYGIIIMDVDKFKVFNDTYGHVAGDEALKLVATVLKNTCRAADSVYRYGGEEFVAVFPDSNLTATLAAAERMRSALEAERHTHEGNNPPVLTVSIGATWVDPGQDLDVERVLQVVDSALYRAKDGGRKPGGDGPFHTTSNGRLSLGTRLFDQPGKGLADIGILDR